MVSGERPSLTEIGGKEEVLYYASDWPHWDSGFPENIDHLGNREDLSPEGGWWLLGGTAKRLYKLNGA